MSLSKSGEIAQDFWLEIPSHFPEVILHEFVVMPNHIHGIIEIDYSVGAKHFSPVNEESDVHVGAKHLSPNGIERANIDSP
jgi:REP element-mobilizing transposase RayT